jgi:putative ABC transport system permease protein
MRSAGRLETASRFRGASLWLPLGLFGLAGLLSRLKSLGSLPVFGYAAALTIVLATALLCPGALHMACWIIERVIARLWHRFPNVAVELRLAMASLVSSISRISISVAALAVSLSMLAAIAVMIGSFRETVIYGGATLRADSAYVPATLKHLC